MTQVRLAHTADLDQATLAAVRRLLDEAFDGGFTDDDWDHTLGGVHALAWHAGELVGHGSVVQRRLLHAGRALRTGYLEAMAVRAGHRRRGHGAAVLAALQPLIRRGYALGALAAADGAAGFYAAHGWQRWRGPTGALTPAGPRRTPDEDGGIYVLPGAVPLDLDADLVCDWRDGDVW